MFRAFPRVEQLEERSAPTAFGTPGAMALFSGFLTEFATLPSLLPEPGEDVQDQTARGSGRDYRATSLTRLSEQCPGADSLGLKFWTAPPARGETIPAASAPNSTGALTESQPHAPGDDLFHTVVTLDDLLGRGLRSARRDTSPSMPGSFSFDRTDPPRAGEATASLSAAPATRISLSQDVSPLRSAEGTSDAEAHAFSASAGKDSATSSVHTAGVTADSAGKLGSGTRGGNLVPSQGDRAAVETRSPPAMPSGAGLSPPPGGGSGGGSSNDGCSRWITYGEGSESRDPVTLDDTVTLGVAGRSADDTQPAGYHGASALLLPASTYVLTFQYDLSTWDSYTYNVTPGFWDSFSVSVTSLPYPDMGFTDPINFLPFLWGGNSNTDGLLESTQGQITLVLPGDPSGYNYLNVVLDTLTLPDSGRSHPSWGSVTLTSVPPIVCHPPVVTIEATNPFASEIGPTTGLFTVSRTGDVSSSLTVHYQFGGNASPSYDFAAGPGFVTIPAGAASVTIPVTALPDGWYDVMTGDESLVLTVVGSGSTYVANAPYSATMTISDNPPPPGSVGDLVWYDVNDDGVQDPGAPGLPGEPGLGGAVVRLLDANGRVVDSTVTSPGGAGNQPVGTYRFNGLIPGTQYRVQFVPLPTFTYTKYHVGAPSADSDADPDNDGKSPLFTVAAGAFKDDIDGGLTRPFGTVGNYVWRDLNNDGKQNDETATGELLDVPGVTVKLLEIDPSTSNLTVVATTATNSFGEYQFDRLDPAKQYRVEFVKPNGYSFSEPYQGDPWQDSNANVFTGMSEPFQVKAGEEDLDIDAGLVTASVGDFVWFDQDRDGTQNEGKNITGEAGVTVKLLDLDGKVVDAEVTGPDGHYQFDNLTPGAWYKVQSVAPRNYGLTLKNRGSDRAKDSDADPATGETDLFQVMAGEFRNDIDAGVVPAGSVGDRVWMEIGKNDGIQAPNEEGVPGVKVQLLEWGVSVVDEQTTDAEGNYHFDGLNPDIPYKVKWVLPDGWTAKFTKRWVGNDPAKDSDADPATGESQLFSVAPGEFKDDIDAGLYTASVGDFVWWDKNGDGIQDDNEPGVAGVTVKLLDNATGKVLQTTTTDPGGLYMFKGLDPDAQYKIQWVPDKRWQAQFSPQGTTVDSKDSDADANGFSRPIDGLRSADPALDFDAGLVYSSVGDFVWWDQNANGVQDKGEPGVARMTVNLIDPANNQVLQTTTTNDSGFYRFDGLAGCKTYKIRWVAPGQFPAQFTNRGQGSDSALDSDADADGTTLFSVAAGQYRSDIDAGLRSPYASVGDRVWTDLNANGLQDGGEPGAAGVTVNLLDAGTVVQSTQTDADGLYRFDGLVPGRLYRLAVVRPANTMLTFFGRGGDRTADSDLGESTGESGSFALFAGTYDSTFDAGLIDLTNRPAGTIVGPGVVPGNSAYNFTMVLDHAVNNVEWRIRIVAPFNPPADEVALLGGNDGSFDPIAGRAATSMLLGFGNSVPGDVFLEAWENNQLLSSKEILIVKVDVTTPARAFLFGTPYGEAGFGEALDHSAVKAVISGDPAGLSWKATVMLTGPQGNRGVDQIHVGFIQHINYQLFRGHYLSRVATDMPWLVNSLESSTTYYLDSASYSQPWYYHENSADSVFFDATPGNSVKTLWSNDQPNTVIPLTFEQATRGDVTAAIIAGEFDTEYRRLEHISMIDRFNLDVAATTVDQSNGANNSYWGEFRTTWAYNGSGYIGPRLPGNFLWTRDGDAGVSGSASWSALTRTLEEIGGPLANDASLVSSFRPSNGP